MTSKNIHQTNGERRDLSWITQEVLDKKAFRHLKELLPELDLENWQDNTVKEKNKKLISQRSSVMAQIISDKGGWIMPQKTYQNDPTYLTKASQHDNHLEDFIFSLPMTRSLATRFNYIHESLIPQEIDEILKNRGKVRIASFGSGTGEDVMRAIKKYDFRVTADMYDIDSKALEIGKEFSERYNLTDRVRFFEQDLKKVVNKDYNLGVMIGIICPLPDTLAKRVMSLVKNTLVPRGRIIVSSSSDIMKEDELGRFLIEYSADWFLQFRDNERMRTLGKQTGYNVLKISKEPMGYHLLGLYEKNR